MSRGFGEISCGHSPLPKGAGVLGPVAAEGHPGHVSGVRGDDPGELSAPVVRRRQWTLLGNVLTLLIKTQKPGVRGNACQAAGASWPRGWSGNLHSGLLPRAHPCPHLLPPGSQ